jgi:hypothetical protein
MGSLIEKVFSRNDVFLHAGITNHIVLTVPFGIASGQLIFLKLKIIMKCLRVIVS